MVVNMYREESCSLHGGQKQRDTGRAPGKYRQKWLLLPASLHLLKFQSLTKPCHHLGTKSSNCWHVRYISYSNHDTQSVSSSPWPTSLTREWVSNALVCCACVCPPENLASSEELPTFSLLWKVHQYPLLFTHPNFVLSTCTTLKPLSYFWFSL